MNTVQFVTRRCRFVSVQQYVVTHEGVNDESEAEGQRDTQLLLSDFSEGVNHVAQTRHKLCCVFSRMEAKEVKEKCLGQDLPRKLLDLYQEHAETIQQMSINY